MKRTALARTSGLMRRTRLARQTPMRPRKAFDSRLGPSNTRLDNLAREVVFARDGYRCVRCQVPSTIQTPRGDADCTFRYNMIQWAHVRGRRYQTSRWLSMNALTLCGGCHIQWHDAPADFDPIAWFRSIRPGLLEQIDALLKNPPRLSRMQVLAMLQLERGVAA